MLSFINDVSIIISLVLIALSSHCIGKEELNPIYYAALLEIFVMAILGCCCSSTCFKAIFHLGFEIHGIGAIVLAIWELIAVLNNLLVDEFNSYWK
jgi:hypothetical protein